MKQSVNFKSKTNLLAANLYTPEQFDESKKYPAITVCHPGGGVKEQTAGMYAEKLAEFGYVRLYMMHHIKVKVKVLLDI